MQFDELLSQTRQSLQPLCGHHVQPESGSSFIDAEQFKISMISLNNC